MASNSGVYSLRDAVMTSDGSFVVAIFCRAWVQREISGGADGEFESYVRAYDNAGEEAVVIAEWNIAGFLPCENPPSDCEPADLWVIE